MPQPMGILEARGYFCHDFRILAIAFPSGVVVAFIVLITTHLVYFIYSIMETYEISCLMAAKIS